MSNKPEVSAARQVTVDADDLDALINLTERSIQMLRSRWNTLPENERQAFVRLREVADHAE